MDDFVCNKLSEWNLSTLIDRFKDQEIDEDQFYNLDNEDIKELIPKVGPRKIFKRQFKLLKEKQTTTATNQETVDSATEVFPSTSEANDTRNMHMDPQEESSQCQSPSAKRKRCNSAAEENIMRGVKEIMKVVKMKLPNEENTKLNDFLKKEICELETRKREQVGVFGKTGAGKSSLINAIIGEKNLLPSGSVSTCISVVFKVEANNDSSKYEAEIEFIKKEDWKDELWLCKTFLEDDDDVDDDDEARAKLTALYRGDWKSKSVEDLMDNKYFKGIHEFLTSNKKTLKCDSAIELRERFVKYISASNEGEDGGRQYWPLVKCVTVRVPGKDLLKQVILVDLPGNGDRNKSRDKMWKKIVGSCSTVWIVADINRAVAEKEAWEILENASGLMGNGGECQRIHFICTKSDNIDDANDQSAGNVRDRVLKRNQVAKKKVMAEFKRTLGKHFSDDCFQVFTVSCKEFHKRKHLQPDDTEIPKLQDFLQSLNHCPSETKNYVSGAHGILSLIQGARCKEVAHKKMEVCINLKKNMRHELNKLKKTTEKIKRTFQQCLTEGVEESKASCEEQLESILHPRRTTGSTYHKALKDAVGNNGVFKAKKGKRQNNINMTLCSKLTGSIDEELRETFPNEGKSGPLKEAIDSFSLDTEGWIKTYPEVKLQLTFLKTEEDKLKIMLNNIILKGKKTVYNSLTETIEENMQKCYEDAVKGKGKGSLEHIRETLKDHVRDKKNTMFQMAKDNMLEQLDKLMVEILEKLERTLMESIELSLGTDAYPFPDVSSELDIVEKYYRELEGSPNPN
ncbi:nuclear GTPase SLIP-GC-like isoform X1 [Paralichthys olivaceus]|uniref:nuclear GTPase SLIP-GC-like isoform X1 n=1 Tax=Paralichthys olivaceus TaxID=8255 RepID=UPI003752CB11